MHRVASTRWDSTWEPATNIKLLRGLLSCQVSCDEEGHSAAREAGSSAAVVMGKHWQGKPGDN